MEQAESLRKASGLDPCPRPPGGAGPASGGRPAPQFLFVHLNKRCNLRCQHCRYWTLEDDRASYLPWKRKQEIEKEYRRHRCQEAKAKDKEPVGSYS